MNKTIEKSCQGIKCIGCPEDNDCEDFKCNDCVCTPEYCKVCKNFSEFKEM